MANKLVTAKTIQEAIAAKDGNSAFLAGGTEVNRLDSSVKADTLISILVTSLDLKSFLQ